MYLRGFSSAATGNVCPVAGRGRGYVAEPCADTFCRGRGVVADPVRVRAISNEEGTRLLRILRRGTGRW